MSQFFQAGFLKPQYFNAAYLHGAGANPPDQTGRSGYWRLFYTQLQELSNEEDRKKREQKQGQETPEGTGKGTQTEPVAVTAPTRKARRVVRKPDPETFVKEESRIHPRPIYNNVTPVYDSITPFLSVISNEFHQWQMSSEPLIAMMYAKKAANDEDEEDSIHLLLMAA